MVSSVANNWCWLYLGQTAPQLPPAPRLQPSPLRINPINNTKIYFTELQTMFVQITKYICSNDCNLPSWPAFADQSNQQHVEARKLGFVTRLWWFWSGWKNLTVPTDKNAGVFCLKMHTFLDQKLSTVVGSRSWRPWCNFPPGGADFYWWWN